MLELTYNPPKQTGINFDLAAASVQVRVGLGSWTATTLSPGRLV
jgi:hypothetical protein